MKRIGVDVGGTFTDFIYVDDCGKIEVYKTSTTPHDPSIGMMEGINAICDKLSIPHGEIDEISTARPLRQTWFSSTRAAAPA